MNGVSSNTSGTSQAKIRFKPGTDLDRLPQTVVDELERRGFVVIELSQESNVLLQPGEPEDKTKIWWQTDLNNVPQGVPLTYSLTLGQWVPLGQSYTPYVPPERRNGADYTAAGASTKLFGPFQSVGTTRYQITIMPTLFWDNVWHTPPVSFPTNFGFFIANKAENSFSVQFYGIPTGGLAWEWQVEVIPADPVSTATTS